ncbi:hypothetical protein [Mycolicibacterium mucogenicum]|uniref:Alkaline shock response membrane anchor protein AmaP n=1 Tax=Mycolicibacterium mucogenicum DSM 44124 TaxID=1226753 RepID=A0A8H2JEZ8_MYCMU|nr:hypothetical protein [Mycolicibacterium mucogenicum]KAB7760708.1 hypothetical protein MMUC44124_05435 [Mycolicibacterium mucogenicum DSM 44124]QPG67983.1 hypothetical protein C1S78_021095 [Mycolicibacterium mucogenicum DSM 44124]
MTATVRFLDRLCTGLAALILLTGAALVGGYGGRHHLARKAAAAIDVRALGRVTEWPWWSAVLVGAGVLLIGLGAWLALLHVRPRSVRAIRTFGGSVDLSHVADAAAEDLARHPSVQSASAVSRFQGGSAVVRITVGVAVATPTEEIRRMARRCGADVRRAAGDDVEFQLLVKPERAEKVRPAVA